MKEQMRARVVTILGVVLVLALALIGLLSGLARPIPDILELLASSSLAGLLGILANGTPTRTRPAGRRRAGRDAPTPGTPG